jgi:hypothetical protein
MSDEKVNPADAVPPGEPAPAGRNDSLRPGPPSGPPSFETPPSGHVRPGLPPIPRSSAAEQVPREQPQEKKKPTPEYKDGTREIIETVVFVVVLVLLLKTFLAEAFVIPTGSMATTLLGYHKDVTCQECGYQFTVNCSDEAEKGGPRVTRAICPNCRFVNRLAPKNLDEDEP